VTPIERRLLTHRSPASLSGAAEWIDWYRARWEIEMPFNVFKNGCSVAELQLAMIDHIERAWLCTRRPGGSLTRRVSSCLFAQQQGGACAKVE